MNLDFQQLLKKEVAFHFPIRVEVMYYEKGVEAFLTRMTGTETRHTVHSTVIFRGDTLEDLIPRIEESIEDLHKGDTDFILDLLSSNRRLLDLIQSE